MFEGALRLVGCWCRTHLSGHHAGLHGKQHCSARSQLLLIIIVLHVHESCATLNDLQTHCNKVTCDTVFAKILQ